MEYIIAHSVKGSTWKKHKYVTKVGNRYVYKDDVTRRRNKLSAQSKLQKALKNGKKEDVTYQTLVLENLNIEQELADINRPLSAKMQKAGLNTFQALMDMWMSTDIYKKAEEAKEHKELLENKLAKNTEAIKEYETQQEEKEKEKEYKNSRQGKFRSRITR